MADLKWAPSDVMEPIRRFLDGDLTFSSIRVEQYMEGDSMVVKAELPGIDPEQDLDVSVADGMLQIKAERQEKSEHKAKNSYRSEFRYGSFNRSIALPPGAREEDITAQYKDGVLEVRAPAKEPSESGEKRKIRIDHS